MKKLASLREHLLSASLNIEAENLLTFAQEGQIISHQGSANQHFELQYHAVIIITAYGGDAAQIAHLVLTWLDQHQPHAANAIKFDADIINNESVDLSLAVKLSEIIKVEHKPEGTYLTTCDEPQLDTTLAQATEWNLSIRQNPNGPPESALSETVSE
ncbi:phage tail protein [Alteromonas sp. a30]|uniref:phage tail protein n=1 Tax=Alteromonas sp. a30 TaxID=2730917 RepID=UPI0022823A43|nr:phage tail protein [Alteromonas sp. a30]MCY7297455.1 phage tail protein [Alteromonas sp. a30]